MFAALGFALVLAPPVVPEIESFTRGIAGLSASIIHMAGGHVQVDGYTLTAPDTSFSIVVAYGCNGVNVIVLLWSAQLAWPMGSWTRKLTAMLLGALIVQAANTLRIISLFYLGQWNHAWFEWMHLYVWEIVIMLLGLAVFAAGARQTPLRVAADPAR